MKIKKFASVLLAVFLLAVLALPVMAAPLPQEVEPAETDIEFEGLVAELLGLAGLSAAIAAFVDIGKRIGFIKPGKAGSWSAGANLLFLIALYAVKIVGFELDLVMIDEQAAKLAELALFIFGYVTQLIGSKVFHKIFSWAGIFGEKITAPSNA